MTGPLGRGPVPDGFDGVLLCVPDAEIAKAAALVTPHAPVGHCSGATGLEVLAPHEGFSLHPLMTITADPPGAHPGATGRGAAGRGAADTGAADTGAAHPGADREANRNPFAGAAAAVAGTTPRALALAKALARSLHMGPVEVAEEDRGAYHAAASIACNFLITLEAAAERLAASAGVERERLIPLVRATVENWSQLGARQALTGPVARGDEGTVERQRDAVAQRAPDLLPLFDALVDATRALAASRSVPPLCEVPAA